MRLACAGDNVVDVYLSLGRVFPGGNAVNVAVAARRAGLESAYLGAVGTDRWGELVLSSLRHEGVDVSMARVVEGPNAYSTIEVVEGDRVFGPADIGVSRFSLSERDKDYLSGFDLVHTGDNSMLEDELQALAGCAPVSYDFGERPPEYWEPLIGLVTIACFSAGLVPPDEVEDLARRAAAYGPDLVLVTEGRRGAAVLADDELHRTGSVSVELVDALGAGDSLTGAFLAGVVAGAAPVDALRAGVEAAAATCRGLGAFGYGVELPLDARWNEMAAPRGDAGSDGQFGLLSRGGVGEGEG